MNIPVQHGYSIFSSSGGNAFAHSRIEIPTINRGLTHSDDLYNARAQNADESDPATELDNMLTGSSVGGEIVQFAKPYFEESEREDIIARVDARLKEIGGGNWTDGAQIVRGRIYSNYQKDSWTVVKTDPRPAVPRTVILMENFPNPFNPSTTIRFSLPRRSKTVLQVYNIRGRLIKTIVDGTFNSRFHEFVWNASNYESGVYIYRLKSCGQMISKKMLYIK